MDGLLLTLDKERLIAKTKDDLTKIVFKTREQGITLIIDDYHVERFHTPFDSEFATALMQGLKMRGVSHVLSDELPDGILSWCSRKGDTLHCDLSKLD